MMTVAPPESAAAHKNVPVTASPHTIAEKRTMAAAGVLNRACNLPKKVGKSPPEASEHASLGRFNIAPDNHA